MVDSGEVAKQERKPTAVNGTAALRLVTIVQGEGVFT
jgi:hypothetical protein